METITALKIQKDKRNLKDRAHSYVSMIMDLLGEIDPENEVAQKIHREIMMLPEYWEE